MEELKFIFTKDEAQTILNALMEQPAKISLLVINKLQDQAAKQLKKEGE